MKRMLLSVIMLLLVISVSAGAEDYVYPYNICDFAPLGSQKADVADFLIGVDGFVCEEGSYDGRNADTYFFCQFDAGDGWSNTYEFQFDYSTDVLYQTIAGYILPEGIDYMTFMEELAEEMGILNNDVYSREYLEKRCMDYDACSSTLFDDDRIALTFGGNAETDLSYATVKIYYFDRIWESAPEPEAESHSFFGR